MLLRTLYHAFSLDAGWFIYDLLWVFVAFTFMMVCYFVLVRREKGEKPTLVGFLLMMVMLYAVLDLLQLAGLVFLTDYFPEMFFLFNLSIGIMLANTRFAKYELHIMAAVFIFLSWAIT